MNGSRAGPSDPQAALFESSLRPASLFPAVALGVVVAAPLLFGCQPPWASGFLVCAVLLLAAAHLAFCAFRGRPWFAGDAALELVAAALLGWLLLTVVHDWLVGPAGGRIPALSLRKLPYAIAFAAAATLGAAYCVSLVRFKHVLRTLTVLGVVLCLFSLLQWAGWDVKRLAGWDLYAESRPSGLYTNPNRFAVLLSICWTCAMALLLDGWARGELLLSRLRLTLLSAALLLLALGIGITLSRLTIVAMGAVMAATVGLLALAKTRGDNAVSAGTAAACFVLPLLAMVAWGVWCLFLGANALRNRFADIPFEIGLEGRFHAALASWPLLMAEPLWGQGLGGFESAFTAVQPAGMPGRWRELHCDWLQLAVEAGLPALLLALAAAVLWGRRCWSKGKDAFATDTPTLFLIALPAFGVLLALLCSIADFPLREPATAMVVFFLAGALVRSPAESPAAAPLPSRVALLAPALALLVGTAVIAARGSAAYAVTPWRGRFYCPPETQQSPDGWRRAVQTDGGDPELHYRLACALLAVGKEEEWGEAREALAAAQALQPRDFRFPWQAALLAERQGRYDDAFQLRESACALAPRNALLREETGKLYLTRVVSRTLPGQEEHEQALDRAVAHFDAVLANAPGREQLLVETLENAGCTPLEVARLWPGQDDPPRVRRARYFCECGRWDLAGRELPQSQPAGATSSRWYHAIAGAMDLQRDEARRGREHWRLLLDRGMDAEIENWLAVQVRRVPEEECEPLAEVLLSRLPDYPNLAAALGERLIVTGHWTMAEDLLSHAAPRSPLLQALWAQVALESGNLPAAEERARVLRDRERASQRWTAWYDAFRVKLRQRGARQP